MLFWPAEKGIHFKFQWKFTLKRGKLLLKPYFLFHLKCYIAHQKFIWTTRNLSFRNYFYIGPKRLQKITINFSTFVKGVKHNSWCLLRPWLKLSFWFWTGSPKMPLNVFELGLNIIQSISNLYVGVFLWIAVLVSIPCMLEKDCNGNPIFTFPTCCAFQMIWSLGWFSL